MKRGPECGHCERAEFIITAITNAALMSKSGASGHGRCATCKRPPERRSSLIVFRHEKVLGFSVDDSTGSTSFDSYAFIRNNPEGLVFAGSVRSFLPPSRARQPGPAPIALARGLF